MMKTHPLLAYPLTLALFVGCGDDGDATDDPSGTSSTTDASSTGLDDPTTGAPGTTSDGEESTESTANADEGSSGGPDPFAGCRRDVLESDFAVVNALGIPGPPQWYGRGAADGELIDGGDTEYLVSSTYITLQPDADLELFNQLNTANAMALFANPGMVALQLGFSMECATARTFTVWESEDAMMEFVMSEAHLQSVSAFPSFSRGNSTLAIWPELASTSEITWDNALVQVANATAYD